MEKGCVYCTEMHLNRCPDAFTEVSKHCGNYNHGEAINLKEVRMRVYIAGAMTGVFGYKERFMEAERYIKGLGHIVVNPAYLPEGLPHYFEINKAMIDQCDAIYVLRGSGASVGTQKEVEYCKSKGWVEGIQIIRETELNFDGGI